jgi:drug/metabolite transporter (DMT)-like permease
VLELRRRDAACLMALSARVAALLLVPPLLWAGNAMVGRLLADSVPPLTLNALRWWSALLLLLPLGWGAVASTARRAELWQRRAALALLGLLGVGAYNALQYLALQTSTPLNVTLIASSTPFWALLLGALFYGERVRWHQGLGALLSLCGVLCVLARGEMGSVASIRLVAGDLWILLAALLWAAYSWLLVRPAPALAPGRRPNWTWAEFLLVQTLFGVAWASAASAAELGFGSRSVQWSAQLGLALVFVAVGPSVLAYRCWGLGVAAVGPAIAAFFANLTPLFAALLSAAWLGQAPRPYHGAAFALLLAGIAVSYRRA